MLALSVAVAVSVLGFALCLTSIEVACLRRRVRDLEQKHARLSVKFAVGDHPGGFCDIRANRR